MSKITAVEFYNMAYARGLSLGWILDRELVFCTFNDWCLYVIQDLTDAMLRLSKDDDPDFALSIMNEDCTIIKTMTKWLLE